MQIQPNAALLRASSAQVTSTGTRSNTADVSQTHASKLRTDTAALAAKVHLPANQLAAFLTDGGRLTFSFDNDGQVSPSAGSPQLSGLPLAGDGTPDFDAIEAAGGTIEGALPGGGAKNTIYGLGPTAVVLYAAKIEMNDGSDPRYVKGLSVSADGTMPEQDLLDVLNGFIQTMSELPNNLAEFAARGKEGTSHKGFLIDRSI